MLKMVKQLVIAGCCMSGTACSTLADPKLAQPTHVDQLTVQETYAVACSTLPNEASIYHIRNSYELQRISSSINQSVPSRKKNQQSHQTISTLLDSKDLLIINMGQKPTGGYKLRLLSKNIQFEGDEASLKIHWQAPAKDMMVTQVLTPFCLALKIPRIRYKTLYITDQNDRILFSLKGPA